MTTASLVQTPPPPRLWSSVWKLLRLRIVILVSGFRRAKLGRKVGMIVLALVIAGAMIGAFVLSWLFLKFLSSPQLAQYFGDTSAFLAQIPVIVLSIGCLMILITSFGVLLQSLYLAGDMDFLLSAPLPIRSIFVSKLLQAILPNFGLVLLFSLPVLYGLGISAGYNILYYPFVLLVLASLALAIAGLASLLVMGVVRIFPPRRVAEVLGFLVAIISITLSQSGNFINAMGVSSRQATQAFTMVSRFNTPWSPLSWVSRGLVALGEGNWLIGGILVFLTLLLTAGIFALSLVTAERLYYTGWASVQVSVRKKKNGRSARRMRTSSSPLVALIDPVVPTAVRGIIAKDFLVLRRDLRNMSQLVTPLILGVLYAFMLISRGGQAPAGRGEAPEAFMEALGNLMVYANVGISLFVGWSLLSRLATMGFSQEGKQYWLLKSAPVSSGKLIAAKYLVAYLPTLALGFAFLVVISVLQQTSPGTVVFSLLVLVLTLAGLAALSLTFGILGARFDWMDPRRINQGSIGCLGPLVSIVYLGLSLSFFFGPALLLQAFGGSAALGQWIGLILGGVFSLAAGFVPLWLARGRVARLAEE